MKNIKLLLLTIGLFIIQISAVQSQISVMDSETILDKLRLNKGENGANANMYSDITGDPYLFKDFKQGKLITISGKTIDVNIRYDIYSNAMQIKDKNEIYGIIHPEKLLSIEVDSLIFIYSKYMKSSDETPEKVGSYFILKKDGKCKLLVKKNIRIQDSEPAKPYQDAKPAKFIVKDDTYFLKIKDGVAKKIRSEKELLSVLSDQKEKLSKFISSNNLHFKNVVDLHQIVSYYNGL